jgi:hypothetical protein
VRKVRADEEAWVADHARARRITARAAVWFLLVLAATASKLWLPEGPWQAAGALLLGGWAGAGCTSAIRRGLGYRSGWLDGRGAMLASLAEAHRRGMAADEWAALELSRDCAVMGVSPTPSVGTDGADPQA